MKHKTIGYANLFLAGSMLILAIFCPMPLISLVVMSVNLFAAYINLSLSK